MRLVLEKRGERSAQMVWASPILALALTIIVGAIIFAARGDNPLSALYTYFIEPLSAGWSIEQLLVKASPLILIGAALAISYRANVWNIGAEGQLTMGAIFAGALPVMFPQWQSPLALIAMLLLGMLGGMAWAAIPALLRTRFNANEILTSLMLVYVSQLLLDWLVRGPWRDPQGFNFPKSVTFEGWHLLPILYGSVHLGVLISAIIALILGLFLWRTLGGFAVRVTGAAPRAGRFAGFSANHAIWLCFLLVGACSGLAGAFEITSVVGQLQPTISPGYGFTAIIVAFLGRLSPAGAIFAALLLALSYLGGEAVQSSLGVSEKIARVFQGMLLLFILACDTLIVYRIRLISTAKRGAMS